MLRTCSYTKYASFQIKAMIGTKVIETRLLPKGNILAITLFGFVFTRKRLNVDRYVLNHELIHCQQQLEWFYLPFFILYLAEWLLHYMRFHDWEKAYLHISFEREAYAHGHDLGYLKRRKHYANYRRGIGF